MKSETVRLVIVGCVVALVSATTAGAAVKMITSKQIKNGTIQLVDISAKARTALKGARGPAGADGTSGVNGASGEAGQTGAAGPSIVTSSGSVIENGQDFGSGFGVSWAVPGGGSVGSESPVLAPPGPNFLVRDLAVKLTDNAAAGAVTATFRVNGSDTSVACSVAVGTSTCSTTNSVSVSAGDLMSIKLLNAGTQATTARMVHKLVY